MKGSNDNTNWDTLDSRTTYDMPVSTTTNFVCATRTTYYRYFMLTVTATRGGRPMIAEMYMFGEAPAAGETIYRMLVQTEQPILEKNRIVGY
jgi:hypothetical protein